jgi:hypothetical protein
MITMFERHRSNLFLESQENINISDGRVGFGEYDADMW